MTEKCRCCQGTKKLFQVQAKCSDMYSHVHGETTYDGYVPEWIGEYGDYISFTICRHCGHVQGNWPYYDLTMNKFSYGKAE